MISVKMYASERRRREECLKVRQIFGENTWRRKGKVEGCYAELFSALQTVQLALPAAVALERKFFVQCK